MSVFRCASCGYSLPASYEHDAKNGRCFLCGPLTAEEQEFMKRELSARRRGMRLRSLESREVLVRG